MILLFALSGIAQHVSTPFSELKEMAACGDGKAQLMLAKHFVDGDSIPKNFYMAMHWYAQAWRNGEGERIKAVLSEMSKPKNRKKYHGFVRFVDGTVVMNIHQDYRQSMKLLQDGRFAICVIPRAVEEAIGVTEDDMDNISSFPRCLAGVEMAATLRQTKDGDTKISVRAIPGLDAAAVCAKFGGGGHKGAAGASTHLGLEDAAKAVAEAMLEQ